MYYWIQRNGNVAIVPVKTAINLQKKGSKIIHVKKEYYWDESSHYFFSKKGTKCSHCGRIRKKLMRVNFPKLSNVPSQSYSCTDGYPENNPHNDWLCLKCWRSTP